MGRLDERDQNVGSGRTPGGDQRSIRTVFCKGWTVVVVDPGRGTGAMKPVSRWQIMRLGAAGIILGGALLGRYPHSVSGEAAVAQHIPSPRPFGAGEDTDSDPIFAAKRLRALNASRHKSMVSDTEKLLKLARQLDAEIASNPSDDLTPEELHQVAEIEKLARNVKAKMAQSFDVGPRVGTSFQPLAGQNPP